MPAERARRLDDFPDTVPVLIAGGGPVGLAAAVELAHRRVGCLVVEPRMTVSTARPRCKTLNVRTMEHLRRWGLADRLRRRAPLPVTWSQDVVFCTSMTGWELSRFTGVLGLVPEGDRFAELGQQAPQYILEEVLREAVEELDTGRLALGARVTDLAQADDFVDVTIENPDGETKIVRAEYVIGADGPRSTVRDRIGSAYHGGQALRPNFGMVFTCPELNAVVGHGPAVQYWVVNPSAPALLGPLDQAGTWWAIAFGVDRDTGEREAGTIIDNIVGRPVSATVVSTDPWTARMQIADRMRDRRVFLAGDAAHLNPPFGGHGLNTGLADAVDLGWKLAAVLDGWAGPLLLDSYELERRPVQEQVIAAATANMSVLSTELLADNLEDEDEAGEGARDAAGARIQKTKKAEFHSLDLVLGLRIDVSPVIPAADDDLAGARLPHLVLDDGRSLYDLLGPGLTLLVLAGDTGWEQVAEVARGCSVPLNVVDLTGTGYVDRVRAALVLVRPDQVVSWSGPASPADAGSLLATVRGER